MKIISALKFLFVLFLLSVLHTGSLAQMNTGKPPKSGEKKDTKTDCKKDVKKGSLKQYLLGKDIKGFPTELNIFYGGTYSSLKYSSFDDFRGLYKEIYNINIDKFNPVASTTWGGSFRIAAMGIELGKIKSTFHTSATEDEKIGTSKGRREFDLDLDENNMAFFIGIRKQKKGFGINIGGGFGNATLKPLFNYGQGNVGGGPQVYLNGVFHAPYRFVTIGPEYYIGYGRLKLVFRYDWSLKQWASANFPNGTAIREDNIYDHTVYGPYIPRNREGYDAQTAKDGAGDGRLYVGSNLRCDRFSIRLTYSLIYRTMPGTKR